MRSSTDCCNTKRFGSRGDCGIYTDDASSVSSHNRKSYLRYLEVCLLQRGSVFSLSFNVRINLTPQSSRPSHLRYYIQTVNYRDKEEIKTCICRFRYGCLSCYQSSRAHNDHQVGESEPLNSTPASCLDPWNFPYV